MQTETYETDHPGGDRSVRGRWVVVLMFVFAGSVTGLLYLYWHLHTAPFRPLTEALAREFAGSHPLVQGGQQKMHKGSPRILRVTLRIEFDPNAEENAARTDQVVDRIAQLAGEHHGLAKYDVLEVHLVRLRPERQPQLREIKRNVGEIPPPQ